VCRNKTKGRQKKGQPGQTGGRMQSGAVVHKFLAEKRKRGQEHPRVKRGGELRRENAKK